jgi:hypothetical protein
MAGPSPAMMGRTPIITRVDVRRRAFITLLAA